MFVQLLDAQIKAEKDTKEEGEEAQQDLIKP